MDKILVSACLLGAKVRYDGQAKPLLNRKLTRWQQQGRLITVCPEVAGGLSIPREPAELQANGLVITTNGANVTAAFIQGAQHALHLCQRHQIRYALLKESSPSCGSQWRYDGNFSGQKIAGQGLTAELLIKHGIAVFSEENIEQLIELIDD
ncbi:DUF523 domain-containing protein [Colwellia sp. MEBiC06753]